MRIDDGVLFDAAGWLSLPQTCYQPCGTARVLCSCGEVLGPVGTVQLCVKSLPGMFITVAKGFWVLQATAYLGRWNASPGCTCAAEACYRPGDRTSLRLFVAR